MQDGTFAAGASGKVLLRHQLTRLYFQGPNGWTAQPEEAQQFAALRYALHFVRRKGFTGVEIILADQVDRKSTAVPVPHFSYHGLK